MFIGWYILGLSMDGAHEWSVLMARKELSQV
jgi:hypothetical protein